MKRIITTPGPDTTALVKEAWQDVGASFERFCLTAGIATLSRMMTEDAERLCGPRHGRSGTRTGHRWGRTKGKIGFHGGTVPVERPRVRSRDGTELPLPSWEAAQAEDWLGQWAMNLMLINVSTRKFGRAVRLPGGDVPASPGDGRSKSAVSRRFVELSATRMTEWMASDLSKLDLVAIQIDGLHIQEELILVGAVGIDAAGDKHPLAVVEGATENAATVQALLDNLIERGLDLRHHLLLGNESDIKSFVTGTLGRHLIFNVNGCNTGALELSYCAYDINGIAVTGFGIAYDRKLHRIDNLASATDHLPRKKDGAVLKGAADVKPGDKLVTRFAEGEIESVARDPRQPGLFD